MVEITPEKEKGKLRYALYAALALLLLLFTSAYEVWVPRTGQLVTPEFREVVWALNLVYVVALFSCAILLVSNPLWMRLLVELAMFTAGLLSGMVVYRVFPFDLERFGPAAVTMGRGVFFALLLALAVGIFITLVRLASGTRWPRRHVHL